MNDTHYEKIEDLSALLPSGNVDVRTQFGDAWVQLGILIEGPNQKEDVRLVPCGQNTAVTLRLITGLVHNIKVSRIYQVGAGTSVADIKLLGI